MQQARQQPELIAWITTAMTELETRVQSVERWNPWNHQTALDQIGTILSTQAAPSGQHQRTVRGPAEEPKGRKEARRLRAYPEQVWGAESRVCTSPPARDCAIQGCALHGSIEFAAHRGKAFCEYHADMETAGHVLECLADDCGQLMLACHGAPIYHLWDTEGCLCARHVKLQWSTKFACRYHPRRLKQPNHQTCEECVEAGVTRVL